MTVPGDQELNSDGEELSFEVAFDRLAKTVDGLESGGLTLDAATSLYEEGMRLVRLCNQLLSRAELKVNQLKDAYSEYQGNYGTQAPSEEGK